MPSTATAPSLGFYGHTVVRAAFVLAMFGWGVGFYGPPIFLHAVVGRTGWPLALVSAAVAFHFLFGAAVVACLPAIHRRFGVPAATAGGAIVLAIGMIGWAAAIEPWQLFVAAMLTGGGWVPLGAAGINAIVSPWFVRQRPMALAKAYNGASVGGMLFLPLWVALIDRVGFPAAAMMVGLALVTAVLSMASREFSRTPTGEARLADGASAGGGGADDISACTTALPATALWRQRGFLTLAAAMALGLFAQIGLIAQLFSLMVPIMGASIAGWVMALATGCGMGGRLIVGRLLGAHGDRRCAAAASYGLQAVGTLLLSTGGPDRLPVIVLGVALFGLGIGNATSLPPLIAQVEFAPADVPRVVARCVALSQAFYAFAPAALAVLLAGDGRVPPSLGAGTNACFGAVLLIQCLAIVCMMAGRQKNAPRHAA